MSESRYITARANRAVSKGLLNGIGRLRAVRQAKKSNKLAAGRFGDASGRNNTYFAMKRPEDGKWVVHRDETMPRRQRVYERDTKSWQARQGLYTPRQPTPRAPWERP